MTTQNPDRPLEILVIDDEPALRELLSECIGGYGAKPTQASDGQEGIEKYFAMALAGTPYDAIFTDLMMPRKSGVDVVREIKKLSPLTPVYVITGKEANREYESLAEQLGQLKPDGVIQKPYNLTKIMDILDSVNMKRNKDTKPSQS